MHALAQCALSLLHFSGSIVNSECVEARLGGVGNTQIYLSLLIQSFLEGGAAR